MSTEYFSTSQTFRLPISSRSEGFCFYYRRIVSVISFSDFGLKIKPVSLSFMSERYPRLSFKTTDRPHAIASIMFTGRPSPKTYGKRHITHHSELFDISSVAQKFNVLFKFFLLNKLAHNRKRLFSNQKDFQAWNNFCKLVNGLHKHNLVLIFAEFRNNNNDKIFFRISKFRP